MRTVGPRRITLGVTLFILILIAAVPAIRWRVVLVALKAAGQLESVDWSDLAYVGRPNSGIRLSRLDYHRNAFTVINNPMDSPADRERGRTLFANNCARCHGGTADGGAGPALTGRAFTHGDSDWALFRTVSHGVPGTAMRPAPLSRDDVWRVIAFLRQLAFDRSAHAYGSAIGSTAQIPEIKVTTPEMLQRAGDDLDDWLLPSATYSAQRFSGDAQINAANVSQLAVQWINQFGTSDARIESVPIVVGQWMYVTLPQGTVMAIDTRNGATIWKYERPPPPDVLLCCVTTNRGVAVLGTRVYVGTQDAHLLALDAKTGRLIWDQTVANYRDGYSITSAPLPVGDQIITGIAGGDFSTRGFITAYDAESGAMRWRTYTIPGPGETGHDTWRGNSWRTGGATTWGIGAYDPQLGLVYWGTGNAAPDFYTADRGGDNLYSNSLLALDAATGRIVWHFQFSPGDDHDWDSIQTPALIDVLEGGVQKRLLAVANRNGFYYVLDRVTGKFVRGEPFVKQTWASGLTIDGRPIRLAGTSPTPNGVLLYPSTNGGTNWWLSAFSPATHLSYVDIQERGGMYFSTETAPSPTKGKPFVGSFGRDVDGDFHYAAVRAIDPMTASVRWEYRNSGYSDWPRGGLLATTGGLVFGSDTSRVIALDASSGRLLWSFDTGGQICAAPVSFRVGDRQHIAIMAGQMLITFALPPSRS